MRRREFFGLIGGAAAWPVSARAQYAGKVHRIGVLRVDSLPASFIEPFVQRLRDLGHLEGHDLIIEYGFARSAAELSVTAAQLVRRKVDVIVAAGTPSVFPARDASSMLPVVFVAAIDPVATGLVTS